MEELLEDQMNRKMKQAAAQADSQGAMASTCPAIMTLKEGVAAGVAGVELARCREAIAQSHNEEQKVVAKRSIASAINNKDNICVEELHKSFRVGQQAGLVRSELAECDQAVKVAVAERP